MTKAQGWLDQKYPTKEERRLIVELNVRKQGLEGELDLSDFTSLEKLDCSYNELTNLKISSKVLLTRFACQNNLLNDLNFSDLNPEKLVYLNLAGNNFPEQSLSCFSKFTKLKEFYPNNWDKEKVREGKYNRFYGSLEPLSKLEKLEHLSISNTNINSGLEYLPANLEKLSCDSEALLGACCKVIAEKLKDFKEGKYYNYQKWREEGTKISPTQKWLDENYPTNERKEKERLIISSRELKGELDLSEFKELRYLGCSNTQLVSLKISGLEKLREIYCNDNQELISLKIKDCPHLAMVDCSSNNKLNSIDFSENLAAINKLNISSCPFSGSLKFLEKLKNLQELDITNTEISEGLEYLPENCKKFYCNTSEYKYKSIEIVKKLSGYLEKDNYYNVSKWQEDKQNNLALLIISSGRLFVIRSNMKQFINKWGKKEEDEIQKLKKRLDNLENKRKNLEGKSVVGEDKEQLKKIGDKISKTQEKLVQEEKSWKRKLDKFSKWAMRKREIKNELSKLQSPKEIDESWWTSRWSIYTTQSIGRGSAIAGAVLLFQDSQTVGGGIATIYPLAELIVSNMEKSRELKESKWKEFLVDADNFLDNCNELLGILDQFEIDKLKGGKVNKAIKDLNKKITRFLENYDENGNKEIDVDELINEKEVFVQDLDKWDWKEEKEESELQRIINAIKRLERVVIEYRRSSYYGESKKADITDNKKEISIDLDKYFEEKSFTSSPNNNNGAQILNTLTVSTSQSTTNVFRKRNISNSKESKSFQGIYELVDLQSKEELQTHIQVPPYGKPSSSK